jgi:hypothetical protein
MISRNWLLALAICAVLEIIVCDRDFQFNTFGHCLKRDDKPNLVKCAGQQMLETLQEFDNLDNFTLVKGLTLSRDESVMGRSNSVNFLDQDPSDIRQG